MPWSLSTLARPLSRRLSRATQLLSGSARSSSAISGCSSRAASKSAQRYAMMPQPGLAQVHTVQQYLGFAPSACRGDAMQRLDQRVVARGDVLHQIDQQILTGEKLRRCSGHSRRSRRRFRCIAGAVARKRWSTP